MQTLTVPLLSTTRRLKLRGGINVIPRTDAVILDGLVGFEVIGGVFAHTLLPELFELLNEERTLAELKASLPGVSEQFLIEVIGKLDDWHFLEDTDAQGQVLRGSLFSDFLTRWNAASHEAISRQTAMQSLINVAILIAYSSEEAKCIAANLRQDLEESFVGLIGLCHVDCLESQGANWSLVISINSGTSLGWSQVLQLGQSRLRWLHTFVGAQHESGVIGPFFTNSNDECIACFQAVCSPAHMATDTLSPSKQTVWASLIALSIINQILFPSTGLCPRQFKKVRLTDWSSVTRKYPTFPTCITCNVEHLAAASRIDSSTNNQQTMWIDAALVYEDYCEGIQANLLAIEANKHDYGREWLALSREVKRLHNAEHLDIEPCELKLGADFLNPHYLRSPDKPAPRSLSLADLGTLLSLTAGIRGIENSVVRRWAPTAGNLGSVELYVAVRSVEGLSPGFYHYEPLNHQLAAVKSRTAFCWDSFWDLLNQPKKATPPLVIIILTGALHRLSKKYAHVAYRLMNLDAGAALTQLHLVSEVIGLCSQQVCCWPDQDIQELLHLSQSEELITGMVEICGTNAVRRSESTIRSGDSRGSNLCSRLSSRQLEHLGIAEITDTVIATSRFRQRFQRTDDHKLSQPAVCGSNKQRRFRLPRPITSGRTVGEVLLSRRSCRVFIERPVELAQLSTVLSRAHILDKEKWSPDQHSQLRLIVVVTNVANIEPGVYEHDAMEHCLIQNRSGLSPLERRQLFVQEDLAQSPFTIAIVADLAAECSQYGAIGHRILLLRAGAMANCIWMNALAVSLKGTIVAGIVPKTIDRLVGLGGHRQSVLVAFIGGA